MTDTIVPSETQTLYCIYCTLQLASNPDLPWTFRNLHKRPQFEATLTPLDQYRTCILLMHAYPTQPQLCRCSQWSSPDKKKSMNKFWKNHLTLSIILLVPTRSHTSIHLQHYTPQHFFIHNKTPHMYMYIFVHKHKTIQTQKSTSQPHS